MTGKIGKIITFVCSCILLFAMISFGLSIKGSADRMADRICAFDSGYCPRLIKIGPFSFKYYPH